MKYLDEYLDRSDVRAALDRCRESRAVQGVIVDLDPDWLSAYRLFQRPGSPPYAPSYYGIWPLPALPPTEELNSGDLKWQPPWSDHAEIRRFRDPSDPVRFRVCVHNMPATLHDMRLPDFSDLRLNIVLEPHSLPSLAAASFSRSSPLVGGAGIGVGANPPGILGGILKSSKQQLYGVTCAHVANINNVVEHPSSLDSPSAHCRIGVVSHAHHPVLFPNHLRKITAHQQAHANAVDVALVELDPVVHAKLEVDTLGPITGLYAAANIQQWQPTSFAGRTSVVRTVEFRGKIVYYNIPNANLTGTYCFSDLYEIQWGVGHQQLHPPVQGGDSGAWLCISGANGYEWAATIVASDPSMGFAVSATALEQWWQGQGLSLSPA